MYIIIVVYYIKNNKETDNMKNNNIIKLFKLNAILSLSASEDEDKYEKVRTHVLYNPFSLIF